jgi:hypothetical protein
LRRDVVGNKGAENIIGHAILLILSEQRLLLKIKTVFTIKIAQRPCGLSHNVNALGLSKGISLFECFIH